MESEGQSQSSDIVLFVIGSTGAGKSQFINDILDEIGHPLGRGMRMEVHDSLSRCTLSICPIRLAPGREEDQSDLGRVVIVDGPGWEDDEVVDQHHQIFFNASQWLSLHYAQGPRCGVIYLQDVSLRPLTMHARAASQSLQASLDFAAAIRCREFALLATKGAQKSQQSLEDPEDVLREANMAWRKVVNAGFPVYQVRHGSNRRHTLTIIQDILRKSPQEQERVLLTLRTELSLSGGRPELSAGFGKRDDIVILILGHLKSGKSTLLNRLLLTLGQLQSMKVKNGLCLTTEGIESAVIQRYAFQGEGARRLILVDTPGFEADDIKDASTLRLINRWMAERYRQIAPACGVIYLHDISQGGYARTAGQIFDLFPLLVRSAPLKSAVIASTKWIERFENDSISKEAELLSVFWPTLIAKGYAVRRLSQEGYEVKGPGSRNHVGLLSELLGEIDRHP